MPTITFTTTAQQAQRISAAVGQEMELGRNATEAEVKSFISRFLRALVMRIEREQAERALLVEDLGEVA